MHAVSEENSIRTAEATHLVGQACRGDHEAFEALYRANVGRIYALCLRLSADVLRAEELTQSVFIKAWEKLGSFRGKSAFSTWLHRLTVNLVLEDKRSERRRTERVLTTDDPALLDGGSVEMQPDVGIDLERAIALLPPGARAAFVLHDIEGYRHNEIAELTGTSPGTSKVQLHRARRLLRKALER